MKKNPLRPTRAEADLALTHINSFSQRAYMVDELLGLLEETYDRGYRDAEELFFPGAARSAKVRLHRRRGDDEDG